MTRIDVELPAHDGTTLRGWLYGAHGRDAAGPGPGVVMAHGFSATKEMALDRYAEVFAAAGLTVLVYDHRGLGASDGEPRQVVDPWAQSRDYRAALTWFGERPEIDDARLGIWGSSYSGGEVMVVAAVDRRVRAVAANVPWAGLPGVDYSDTTAAFRALRAALDDPAGPGTAAARGAPAGPVAVVEAPDGTAGAGLPAFLPQPESTEWFLRAGGEGTRWENRVWLGSAPEGAPFFDPGVAVAHVAPTPLLMVVATNDTLAATDVALASFARAGEPKQLEVVEGHHFTPYDGEAFTRVAAVTSEFFTRKL
jgi:fermentation-respiration switch protein FrsA (DUF1100 family)